MKSCGIVSIVCLVLVVHDATAGLVNLAKGCIRGGVEPFDLEVAGPLRDIVKIIPDWSNEAQLDAHLWRPTSKSDSVCFKSGDKCSKKDPLVKCSACRMVAHTNCISHEKEFPCKPSFTHDGVQPTDHHHHHWINRGKGEGNCIGCNKPISPKSKKIVAKTCAWCKSSYHVETCFDHRNENEACRFGEHSEFIIPPSWITKRPGPYSGDALESHPFQINSPEGTTKRTLIVFINPKSGEMQGIKLLKDFQWLLNPRQVFVVTNKNGPEIGLSMYKHVENLWVLSCGGDGTGSWVLSGIDKAGLKHEPVFGVLPSGTGNDLARYLGWGKGYEDEPISPILKEIENAEVVSVDRWHVVITPNEKVSGNVDGVSEMRLNAMTNYMSIGADALFFLQFHQARESESSRIVSRTGNFIHYTWETVKDLVQRKWKGLSGVITVDCRCGDDITVLDLKKYGVHTVALLNLPFYSGGTKPWDNNMGKQSVNDGKIEVVGLTVYQFAWIQTIGKHATSIAQCEKVTIVTEQAIPVQVDGEPVLLKPSKIEIYPGKQVKMLQKPKSNKQKHNNN